MNTKTLEKFAWEEYFNRFSKALGACLAEVEVAGLDIGDQIEAEWIVLSGISYDPKDDIVTVDLVSKDDENFEHIIHRPAELVIQEDVDGVKSLTIVDADDHRQIIHLRKPLALPPA